MYTIQSGRDFSPSDLLIPDRDSVNHGEQQTQITLQKVQLSRALGEVRPVQEQQSSEGTPPAAAAGLGEEQQKHLCAKKPNPLNRATIPRVIQMFLGETPRTGGSV